MVKCIGIRREDKNEWESRVPLLPKHVEELRKDGIEVILQPSNIRAYEDEEYIEAGAKINEDLSKCDLILGVKEMPKTVFREHGTYMFFSHTIKGQPYNMPMLKELIDKKCNLIDYEKITDANGKRLIFFGRHAGIAGMIDSLSILGRKLEYEGIPNPFNSIRLAHTYRNLEEARYEISRVAEEIEDEGLPIALVPLVVGFAGYGNVSKGAQEIFDILPYEEIKPEDLKKFYEEADFDREVVYKVVFKEEHMVRPKEAGKKFDLQEYYKHPERYEGCFDMYLPYLTMLINCIYWEAKYPRLVTKKDLKALWTAGPKPRLRVIGDISCDLEGSIEANVKITTPGNPVYVWLPKSGRISEGVEGYGPAILAVDNLPCEIAKESSEYFSEALFPFIKPILQADFSGPLEKCNLPPEIRRGLILYHGDFTPEFKYMEKFVAKYVGGRVEKQEAGKEVGKEKKSKSAEGKVKVENMKRVAVLGAGMVSGPMIKYLLEHGFHVTQATRTVEKAEKLIREHPNGAAVRMDITKEEDYSVLDSVVQDSDLVVSLLPYIYHVKVAELCLKYKKHLVTTSYVSDAMKKLDEQAKEKGVIFLNEIGLDPGIDHMTAMKIIEEVHAKKGKVIRFDSICGGLPAPDSNNNPLGYKFSWSPRGVILAGKNSGKFLKDGEVVEIPNSKYFKTDWKKEIPGIGNLEYYTNRSSLQYNELYRISEIKTLFRGTFRYPGWCDMMATIVDMGLLDETPVKGKKDTLISDYLKEFLKCPSGKELKSFVAEKYNPTAETLKRFEWLGLFGNEAKIKKDETTMLDILADRMEELMQYKKGERDMIVLHHEFDVEYPDGKKEMITSTLIDYGQPEGETAMERTVSLPAAIAVKMILNGEIKDTGVIIPVKKTIYEPVLDELEKMGIKDVVVRKNI
ncbi:MAG: saccharopine dehydrogenase C-terminal domain-containing protein [Thermoplasmata archaeon]